MSKRLNLLLLLAIEGVLLTIFGIILIFTGDGLINKFFLTGISSLVLVAFIYFLKSVSRKTVE